MGTCVCSLYIMCIRIFDCYQSFIVFHVSFFIFGQCSWLKSGWVVIKTRSIHEFTLQGQNKKDSHGVLNLLTGTARNQCAIKLIFGGFSRFNLIEKYAGSHVQRVCRFRKKAMLPCGNIAGICKQKLHFFNNAFFEMFFSKLLQVKKYVHCQIIIIKINS